MADEIDFASEHEEAEREASLKAARNAPRIEPDLPCRDCGPVLVGKDCAYYADCLKDWEKREEAKKRNGVRGIN